MTRPKPISSSAIQVTDDAISTDGAKLVEIPVLPRRIRFHKGNIAKRSRRATRKKPLVSPWSYHGVEDVRQRETGTSYQLAQAGRTKMNNLDLDQRTSVLQRLNAVS